MRRQQCCFSPARSFVGFDEDGGYPANIAASEASYKHSERRRAEQSKLGPATLGACVTW
jgi:hypothetical protein